MTTTLLLVAAFAALPVGPPVGCVVPSAGGYERLPHPTAYRMANTARAVVEGTVGDGGVVTITKRYYVEAGDRIGATIAVPSLAKMSREVENFPGMGGEMVEPAAVLLFLAKQSKPGEWEPLHLCGESARGVLWLEEEHAYGYFQAMNPGGYVLGLWRFLRAGEHVPADPKALREVVTKGVVARIKWRDTLRLRDRGKRAEQVATWFSPSTSPDGERWQERLWPDLLQACDDLGSLLVVPLARIVKTDREPAAVGAAADALARLGPGARAAVPALIARLRDPRGAQSIFLLRALRQLADPRAADVLRDFVPHRDPFVAAEAARALHAAGGADAAVLLRDRIPEERDAVHTIPAIASLLEALHEMDPVTAERLVVERFRDLDQLMMQRAWLRRLR